MGNLIYNKGISHLSFWTVFSIFLFSCSAAQAQLVLIDYARKGDLEGIKRRLASGDKVDQAELEGFNKSPGSTPLRYAVRLGRADIVRCLIENGANVNLTHGNGTPLAEAARGNRMEIAKLLLNAKADPNRSGPFFNRGDTPLYWALRNGHFEMAEYLVGKGAKVHFPLYADLLELVTINPAQIVMEVEFLIKHGLDVRKPYRHVSGDLYPLYLAVRETKPAVVRLLIKNGADVNSDGSFGGRALNQAAWQGNQEMVRDLIKAGADVNAGTGVTTPLGHALANDQLLTAELLIKHKAAATTDVFEYLMSSTRPTPEIRKAGVDFLLANGLNASLLSLQKLAEKYDRPEIAKYLRSIKPRR